MKKRRLLFSINQFYKGGAETALLNLFRVLSPEKYEIDFLIFDQIDLKGSLSLIPLIPDWVHVINAGERERLFAYVKKAYFRIYRDLTQKQLFRRSVRRYLRDKSYDVAISFGEWFSCAPVATMVRAARKYVWVHADMDKVSFLHPDILAYQQYFDKFIFVSGHSQQGAVARYPFLSGRSVVIHNLVDKKELQTKSVEQAKLPFPPDGLPLLVTVANVRPEKNHLRQIQAMKLLWEEGIHFRWLNIGSLANREQTALVEQAACSAGLEKEFRLIGAVENPYPYMKAADAVCVLSDHESWSMVITEAKALGVPVIATRTSGALEQIVHRKSGILCDFAAEDIASKIKEFLLDPSAGANIQRDLVEGPGQDEILPMLDQLFLERRQKLLYLFDDLNYQSGARCAALGQADILKEDADLTLFSVEPCQDDAILQRYQVFDLQKNFSFRCLSMPWRCVLGNKKIPFRFKLLRTVYAVLVRMSLDDRIYDFLLGKELACFMNGYDVICVTSEASKLRGFVSTLNGPRKIQWVHTDYAAWRNYSAWTRAITRQDGGIYPRYDTIVLLSERLRDRFIGIYPHLAEKTVVIPNLIDNQVITGKASAPCTVAVDRRVRNLITIGRMEREKRYDRLLEVASELKGRGVPFHWYFVGDGALFADIQDQCRSLGLSDAVTLTGALENPYPLLSQCNLFVLFSDYEGTPVTIDEAKVLGVPVLSADVGGILDQLENERYGNIILNESIQFVDEIIKLFKDTCQSSALTNEECRAHNMMAATALKALIQI